MADKKLITILGATGVQGGSVVHHILNHPDLNKTWTIRAVTRDTSKPAAIALKEKGAQVVTADMDSQESLENAVRGAHAVFGVTNFWEHMDGKRETQQGKNLAQACQKEKVDRLIFSSLPNVTEKTNGENTGVKHFDSKAHIAEYIKEIGLSHTLFMPGVYMSGLLSNFRKQDGSDTYTLAVPHSSSSSGRFPVFDAAKDSGLFVAAILLNLSETLNKSVLGSSGYITAEQMASDFAKVTGNKAQAVAVPVDTFRSFLPAPIQDEITANFVLFEKHGYYVGEDPKGVENAVALVERSPGLPKPTSWADHVKQNFKE